MVAKDSTLKKIGKNADKSLQKIVERQARAESIALLLPSKGESKRKLKAKGIRRKIDYTGRKSL